MKMTIYKYKIGRPVLIRVRVPARSEDRAGARRLAVRRTTWPQIRTVFFQVRSQGW